MTDIDLTGLEAAVYRATAEIDRLRAERDAALARAEAAEARIAELQQAWPHMVDRHRALEGERDAATVAFAEATRATDAHARATDAHGCALTPEREADLRAALTTNSNWAPTFVREVFAALDAARAHARHARATMIEACNSGGLALRRERDKHAAALAEVARCVREERWAWERKARERSERAWHAAPRRRLQPLRDAVLAATDAALASGAAAGARVIEAAQVQGAQWEQQRVLARLHGATVRLADGSLGDADIMGWPDPAEVVAARRGKP